MVLNFFFQDDLESLHASLIREQEAILKKADELSREEAKLLISTPAFQVCSQVTCHDAKSVWWGMAVKSISGLTHWGQDKMAAILQTTVSNGFSWMKMYEFRYGLTPAKRQAIIWTNDG